MNKLPPELIDAIGSHFDYSDWCALRLTCKIFYQLSSSHFARRYFRYVSVILTRDALAELESLTLHESFRRVVEELSIIPQAFGDYEMDLDAFKIILHLCTPESQAWTVEEVQAQYLIYEAAQTDHLAFAESVSLVKSLTRCLERLENVSIIGLRPYPSQRPDSQNPFVCLGMRALRKQLPFDPCIRFLLVGADAHRPVHRNFISRSIAWTMWKDIRHPVWAKGLTSLFEAMCAASPPLKVQRLYTCHVEDEFVVPPDCFTLSQSLYQSLKFLLRELRDLEVRLGPSNRNESSESLPCLVIRAAPNLHILRLTLWDQFHHLSADNFTNLAKQVRFTCLSELHLQWVELTQPSFQLFLRTAAPTLQVLTLIAVSLNDPIPVRMGSSSEFREAMSTLWRHFLNTLRDTIPGVNFFRMRGLAYRQRRFSMNDPLKSAMDLRNLYSHDSYVYKINTTVSFTERINQLELRPGCPLEDRRLPRHRSTLTV
ncbi:hypothetical protein CBS147323_3383 [Aspergillus niger]|nr:hypothetical protein CBS147323_3383 [Aspergillus niger]